MGAQIYWIKLFWSSFKVLNYYTITMKLMAFVGSVSHVLGMNFHTNPFPGTLNRGEKVLWSSCKVPLILNYSNILHR
jgi:hypothetical protein